MSDEIQTKKNIDLSFKFMKYLLGKRLPEMPNNVSYVPFAYKDEKLNRENKKLLDSLMKEDNPLASIYEPKTANGKWKIIPMNF